MARSAALLLLSVAAIFATAVAQTETGKEAQLPAGFEGLVLGNRNDAAGDIPAPGPPSSAPGSNMAASAANVNMFPQCELCLCRGGRRLGV
jgi:hypothetical protein